MDTRTVLSAIPTATLAGVTFRPWCLGVVGPGRKQRHGRRHRLHDREVAVGGQGLRRFIGSKIFLAGIIDRLPAAFSLNVSFGLIAGGVLPSLWTTRGQRAPTGAA